jgi:alpha-galactosidase
LIPSPITRTSICAIQNDNFISEMFTGGATMTETSNRITFEHGGMTSVYSIKDGTCIQHGFVPGQADPRIWEYVGLQPFTVAVAGKQYGGLPAIATAQTEVSRHMKLIGHVQEDEGLKLNYFHDEIGLEVEVATRGMPSCAVIRVETKATNRSDRPITLTHLSSAYIQGIALEGCRPWHDKNKMRVHYCRQSWAGEGQWRRSSLEEMGLYVTATHSDRSALHLTSEGSWSTSRYAPMLVLEDMEASQVWFSQIESSSPWHFELGVRGSIWEDGKRAMYIQADGASERVGGWSVTLQPGESFEAVPVAIGCCSGGFSDAVRELTLYRRMVLKKEIPITRTPPVIYNDYMNGIWADPSEQKLQSLIDATAECGVEVYCMDAGWFGSKEGPYKRQLGDWQPSADKFGPGGLQAIILRIRDKGMIPGIWLEMEVCGEDAELGKKPDDWFLQLNGNRVGGGERWFLNFTNPEVRQYLHEVIDRLIAMGIGYIKNDYNACIGPGDDVIGTSPADGLLRHMRAFYRFIDEVRERHPLLILENCGCGAMRLDYGIQSHFHLASFSDQENYTYATSIMAGTLAFLLPEQTGIWCYPFPQTIQHKHTPEVLQSSAYLLAQADGEQTVYNIVNALCGVMTLAGRIDMADKLNRVLIREGIDSYKNERHHIENSYPVWPLGMPRIGGADEWASVGLVSSDRSRLLLAVWRRETASEYCEIPLEGFQHTDASIQIVYPIGEAYGVDTYYNRVKGSLTVRFPKRNQARMFEIRPIRNEKGGLERGGAGETHTNT